MDTKMTPETNRRIAIITGGSSGLGISIARKFTDHGIFTIIIGRDKKKLDAAVASMKPMADRMICDLSKLECIPHFVGEIMEKFQRVDILVNNAGIHLKKPMVDVTNEEFQLVILTNLTSVFTLSREVAGIMLKQKSGCILNISSMAAHYGIPKVIAYTAAKAGIEGMTRAMAVELSPSGIRVNCLAPGFIQTDMSAAALNNDPERKNKVLSRTPMGRLGMPEDVASAALFLVTDAAAFITGAVLPVDGGNSIGF
jgi:NAD(P)-dependent dehydrogenase (short-subunit alcohol dehydrogenase family)